MTTVLLYTNKHIYLLYGDTLIHVFIGRSKGVCTHLWYT